MISEPVLRLAVERSIVSADQATALQALARAEAARTFEPMADQESFRFISGFGDIFVVIGLFLFLGAAGYFLLESVNPRGMFIILAGLSWLLAELFTRRRRMALPSIVLLVAFTAFSFLALNALANAPSGVMPGRGGTAFGVGFSGSGSVAFSALLTCVLVALHYWRFRVPITVAAGVGALLTAGVAALVSLAPRFMSDFGGWIMLILGGAVFCLAMYVDRQDLKRETRKTDIAFWLHLMAAPMLVHSFIATVFGGIGDVTTAKAVGLIGVFGLLAVMALLIDRRAILVSALVYAGVAFGTLFKQLALTNATIPASLLVLGAFILGLSTLWQPLRRAVLKIAPAALQAELPPATGSSKS